jgi:branched-chain amino acid transport system permease protein
VGFWWGLVLAPPIVGLMGALFERFALRRVHKFGHVPELLITFGLSYIILELVQLIWGRQAVDFQPPESLRGPLFTIVSCPTSLWPGARRRRSARRWPAPSARSSRLFRAFMHGCGLLMLVAVWLLLTRTRIGLVIQAALTHPERWRRWATTCRVCSCWFSAVARRWRRWPG